MACIYARTDREAEAVEELEACLVDGCLPEGGAKHLDEDTDLDGIRGLPEYQAFRAELEA